jgi:hypothetical protein
MVRVGRCCAATINGPESEFRLDRLVVLLRIDQIWEGVYSDRLLIKVRKDNLGLQFGGAYKEFFIIFGFEGRNAIVIEYQ